MITKVCARCGVEFIGRPVRQFCSIRCKAFALAKPPNLVTKRCEICAAEFSVRRYRETIARFCSGSCRATFVGRLPSNKGPKPHLLGNKHAAGHTPRNSFKPGHKPWNAGMKGIHLSPGSQFKPGHQSNEHVPIGTVTIRVNKRDNIPRAWVKVAEPNVWRLRASEVWEAANGPVPPGKILHHHDRDSLNDALDNLRCLTKSEHIIEHQQELWRARRLRPRVAS